MLILFLLSVALIFRLINLNQSLWLDEAVQAITAKENFGYIFSEITGDFHPPLFHFLMHFWVKICGSSEVALRLPSVLFGVGTVLFVYKLGKLREDEKLPGLGSLAALFLATAPFHVFYSQEARMYSMVTFFTVGSFYFLHKLLKVKEERLTLILYLAFTLLALYSDYYAFLALFAQWIILLCRRKFKLVFYSLTLLLFYLPWLSMFSLQIKTGMLATQALPQWARLVNLTFVKALPLTFIKFSIGRIRIFDKVHYVIATVTLFGVYAAVLLHGFLRGRKAQSLFQTLLSFWLVVPIFLAWAASLFIPNYQPFRLLLVLPAFYLLLAQGILAFNKKRIKLVLITFVLAVNLLSLSIYYSAPYFHREDWRGVVRFLKNQQNSLVVLPSQTSNWPIKYYDPEGKIKLVSISQGVKEIEEVKVIEGKKIFYIRYLVPLFDPEERILAELKRKGYTKVKEENFNQIPLWQFQKQ